MKTIIRTKAEGLIEFYRTEYRKAHGEMYSERNDNGFAKHLWNLSIFDQRIHKYDLEKDESDIVNAFFKTNNDQEFKSLISNFLLNVARIGFNNHDRDKLDDFVLSKLQPIIQNIAFTMFIYEGVSSILEDDQLSSHG